MELYISKCRSIGRINYPYVIDNYLLLFASDTITDLYIVFHRELNFYAHLDGLCCKALKTLRFLKRVCSEFKFVTRIKSLYCAFVRLTLEYGAVVSDPSTSCGMNQVERVRLRGTFLNFAAFVLKIDHPVHDTPIPHP